VFLWRTTPSKAPCGEGQGFGPPVSAARLQTCGYLIDTDYGIFRLKHIQKSWQISYAINWFRLY